MRTDFEKGLTLVELLVIVNIVAILAGAASVLLSEYSDEAKAIEAYNVFPQIVRSEYFYYMKHNEYYSADHNDLKDHGVDVSEAKYFTDSTFSNEFLTFSVKADATEWATGGWILYDHKGDPTWSCDGILIKRSWLPE